MYVAFHAIKNIKDIDKAKHTDEQNKIAKRRRKGLPDESDEPEPEPEVIETAKKVKNIFKKKFLVVEEKVVRPTDEKKEEISKYGRYWMFVNYFSEEEDIMNLWYQGACSLAKINGAVIKDMDDYILLQGFKNKGLSPGQIQEKIDKHLEILRARDLMRARKNKLEVNPVEDGQAEDKKRAFLDSFGPDCHIWNFEEEDNPTPHVMRNKADPAKAYVDGRI